MFLGRAARSARCRHGDVALSALLVRPCPGGSCAPRSAGGWRSLAGGVLPASRLTPARFPTRCVRTVQTRRRTLPRRPAHLQSPAFIFGVGGRATMPRRPSRAALAPNVAAVARRAVRCCLGFRGWPSRCLPLRYETPGCRGSVACLRAHRHPASLPPSSSLSASPFACRRCLWLPTGTAVPDVLPSVARPAPSTTAGKRSPSCCGRPL